MSVQSARLPARAAGKTNREKGTMSTDHERLSVGDLLTIADLSRADVETIFETARRLKSTPADFSTTLNHQTLVLIFEKPSLRTRCTFEIGVAQLGGHSIYLDHTRVRLGERESIRDVARSIDRWAHGIVARTYKNKSVIELAEHAQIPVINGLTDLLHPCQGLTDLFTMHEHFGSLSGLKVCFVGDGNNTCHSLIFACAVMGIDLTVVTPEGFEPNSRVVNSATTLCRGSGASLQIENDVGKIAGHSVIYTDTWVSMGQESETEERTQLFSPYQVTTEMIERAGRDTVFFHCLPAHRGAEVTAEVIDSPRSLVYQQAENRLHVQKALMHLLMGAPARDQRSLQATAG